MTSNEQTSMTKPEEAFTAARVAVCLSVTPQAIRKALRGIEAASVKIVGGIETAAWRYEQLPEKLRTRLQMAAFRQHYRNAEAMLGQPPKRWQPAVPLAEVCQEDIEKAEKLRTAMLPWVSQQHSLELSANRIEELGVQDYARAFGGRCSHRYWRELFQRTVRRDAGAECWQRLEIYLKESPKAKTRAGDPSLDHVFEDLKAFIEGCTDPLNPNRSERYTIWFKALRQYHDLVKVSGIPPKKAGRWARAFLFSNAPFLAATRDTVCKAFNRKVSMLEAANWDFTVLAKDGRVNQHSRVELPQEDIDLLRWSSATQNGGRIDAAWREVYEQLSAATRAHYPPSLVAPRRIHEILGRKEVDALFVMHHQGKRGVKDLVGDIEMDNDLPAMASWSVDDLTSNIEVVVKNGDGSESLIQPQVVAVMDKASRKFVGWAVSNDKGPTAELSCAAILDAFRQHGVPKEVVVENGFTFGKAININGRTDDQGRTLVAGLAAYGCDIRHFSKRSPKSKGELEKGFDLLQQRMERHPGYTGRLQMIDAPEEFKREQRLIRSGKVKATEFRYTFQEFLKVFADIVQDYNAKPQKGDLNGLSPDEAHDALKNAKDPEIRFEPALEWWLANERYRLTVQAGGVTFRHYGQQIRVRGGRLAGLIGRELWALVDRDDPALGDNVYGSSANTSPDTRRAGHTRGHIYEHGLF